MILPSLVFLLRAYLSWTKCVPITVYCEVFSHVKENNLRVKAFCSQKKAYNTI